MPYGLGRLREWPMSEPAMEVVGEASNGTGIAEELVVSEGTVKTHLTHILRKLDLPDRVAVVLAYEIGLVRPGQDAG
jgi:ATP/maltotriose-dependent transcriptional regulator MalT